MAKGKGKNVQGHLRARLDYLHKAASYLQSTTISAKQQAQHSQNNTRASDEVQSSSARNVPQILNPYPAAAATATATATVQKESSGLDHLPNISRAYISQLRGISLKTQLRLPQEVKRSICKRCDTLLVRGASCVQEISNASHGGQKLWADVRVVRCVTCGTEKRYPQAERRSKKLAERRKEKGEKEGQAGGPG